MSRGFSYSILALFGCFLLSCMGLTFPLEVAFHLLCGWAYFAVRVVPGVTVDRGGVAIGVTCLVLFAGLAHSFCGWLHRQVRGPEGPGWRARWTASMVGGVVLMFAAGIAAAGVAHQAGWLLTSREPLIDASGVAVYRSLSVNNLKQIGLALDNYEQAEKSLPPAATLDAEGRLLHGWQARVLPYLEMAPLYNQINFAVPWDDPRNESAYRTRVRAYLNPRVRSDPEAPGPAPSHYSGNALVLGGDAPRKTSAIPDGASNTIAAGEAAGEYKPWGHPTNWRDPNKGLNRSPDGFGGPFRGGANFLFADGSVRFVKDTIDPRVFRALGTPDGGETVKADEY